MQKEGYTVKISNCLPGGQNHHVLVCIAPSPSQETP